MKEGRRFSGRRPSYQTTLALAAICNTSGPLDARRSPQDLIQRSEQEANFEWNGQFGY
jgi:hypothetical protein